MERRTFEECVMSREERELYSQRPGRLKAIQAGEDLRAAALEMAQLDGIPRRLGSGSVNPEYGSRIRLAREVYTNGCQVNTGACGSCERFDTNLCQVLAQITLREEQ